MGFEESIERGFEEIQTTLTEFVKSPLGLPNVGRFAEIGTECLRNGGKFMSCGNGGSMCDAMHFAEEWTGRFRQNRDALPAIAFSDPGQLSCMANDFGYDQIFARSVEAYGRPGDVLVAISTSGNSPNVINALAAAKEREIATVGLLGKGGGQLLDQVDVPILVPLATTSDRIQEIHIKVIHIVIEAIERELFPENYA